MGVDVDRFLRQVTPAWRAVPAADLATRLDAFDARGRAAWPTITIDRADFLDHVAVRIAPGAPADVLDSLYAEDLYLACACARGDEAAIAACERAYAGDVERGLDSIRLPTSLRDEVWSRLRTRIFVATPTAAPAISSFTGAGSLKKWLRVAATRLGLNAMRELHREEPLPDHDLPEAVDDLALGHLKRTYQAAFKTAFSEALAELTPEQRTLLRMHVIDKLTIDDLARMHRVHRTSTARWLREAREALAERTRARLHAALGVADEELDSIMNLVRSRLDLSLSRLFRG